MDNQDQTLLPKKSSIKQFLQRLEMRHKGFYGQAESLLAMIAQKRKLSPTRNNKASSVRQDDASSPGMRWDRDNLDLDEGNCFQPINSACNGTKF